MLSDTNYIINTGHSFRYYNTDGTICENYKLDYTEFLEMRNSFRELYYRQIAILNSDSRNIYIINLENVSDISVSTIFLTINFLSGSLIISFLDEDSANDNYDCLNDKLNNYNAVSIFETANKIYVPDDYATIQAAIDNKTTGDVIWVKQGSYNESLTITDATTMYFEEDAHLNNPDHIITANISDLSQEILIYGSGDFSGHIRLVDTSGAEDSQTGGAKMFIAGNIFIGTVYHGNNGILRMTGYSFSSVIGNLIDTDTASDVADFDFVSMSADNIEGIFIFPLSQNESRIYFRGCISEGYFNLIPASNGIYKLKLIDCYHTGHIYNDTSYGMITELWSSYIISSQTYFIYSSDSTRIYLKLFGNNYSNKPYPSYVTRSGVGKLTIDINLN